MLDGASELAGVEIQPRTENLSTDQLKSKLATEAPRHGDLAKREIITNEDGTIQDIAFIQNGKTIKLKEFFPGDYHIIVRELSESDDGKLVYEYDNKTNTVTVTHTGGSEGIFNISLLHEAGHAVDINHQVNKYKAHAKKKLDSLIRLHSISSSVSTLKYSSETLDQESLLGEISRKVRSYVEDYGRNYDEHQREELFEKLRTECLGLVGTDPESLTKATVNAALDYEEVIAEEILDKERSAWQLTLKGIRAMRVQGVNLFDGSNSDMLEHIDYCLEKYQEGEGRYLKNGQSFLRKNRK